jgi:hypothetical protein
MADGLRPILTPAGEKTQRREHDLSVARPQANSPMINERRTINPDYMFIPSDK